MTPRQHRADLERLTGGELRIDVAGLQEAGRGEVRDILPTIADWRVYQPTGVADRIATALIWRSARSVRGLDTAQLLDAAPELPPDNGAGDYRGRRHAHWLDVELDGVLVRVYVAHMIASQHVGGPRRERYKLQMRRLADLVDSHPGPAAVLLDKNLVPGNRLEKPLRDVGLESVWDYVDPDEPTHGNRTIDDCMFRGLELVGQPVVVQLEPVEPSTEADAELWSDHGLLLAELRRAA